MNDKLLDRIPPKGEKFLAKYGLSTDATWHRDEKCTDAILGYVQYKLTTLKCPTKFKVNEKIQYCRQYLGLTSEIGFEGIGDCVTVDVNVKGQFVYIYIHESLA